MAPPEKDKPFAFEQKQDRPRGIDLSRDDLIKIYRKLEIRTKEAAELEIENWQRKEGQTDEEFEGLKKEIREAYTVHIRIEKQDRSSISSLDENIFSPEKFPERVIAITFESGIKYKAITNMNPRNQVQLNLDFGRIPVFDAGRLPNLATPNNSFVNVFGQDRDWINAVHGEIMEFINNRRSVREWLHKQSIYDALLLLVGLPLAFWIIYRVSPFFENLLKDYSFILISAVYVYFFFFSLYIFRYFFSYVQWVWPPNVIEGVIDSSKKHRLVIGGIILAIITDVGVGVFRLLF